MVIRVMIMIGCSELGVGVVWGILGLLWCCLLDGVFVSGLM